MYFAPTLLTPDAWCDNVSFTVDESGAITDLQVNQPRPDAGSMARVLDGPVIPGMTNVHSHAFQRRMAGVAEWRSSEAGDDSFWSWRELMYQSAAAMNPQTLEQTATTLYQWMLRSGFTEVCEFHYLHHLANGVPCSPSNAMSQALINAAKNTGIRLMLLPTLYQHSGFKGKAPNQAQRQFVQQTDAFLELVEGLRDTQTAPEQGVGIAAHSIRAVDLPGLHALTDWVNQQHPAAPFHIHISEQPAEVAEARKLLGTTPIEWLYAEVDLPTNTCLVHATHATDHELELVANAGHVIGLCPATEANLGDGLFELEKFIALKGRIALGTDSHVEVSPTAELRLLEYGQRLRTGRRVVAASDSVSHSGEFLWQHSVSGGRQVAGHQRAGLERGGKADFIVLDPGKAEEAGIECSSASALLDSWIYCGDDRWISDVYVGGRAVVQHGRILTANGSS